MSGGPTALVFDLLRPREGLSTFDHEPTDGIEGITDSELNHWNWKRGLDDAPYVPSDQYAAFDLDGRVLEVVHGSKADLRHLEAEWVLGGTGTGDLPRLEALASASAEMIGFKRLTRDALLEIANCWYEYGRDWDTRPPRGNLARRLFGERKVPPPPANGDYDTR